jgi:hypothetical protein
VSGHDIAHRLTETERRARVRCLAAHAARALVGALATDDGVELTVLIGEADGCIEKARNELLRGPI